MSNLSKENENYLANYKYDYSFEFPLIKVNNLESVNYQDTIVAEFPLGIVVNGKYENTFLCSPFKLKELVVGYLCSRNLISCKEDILNLEINHDKKIAYVDIDDSNFNNDENILYLNEYDFLKANPICDDNLTITVSDIYKTMETNLNLSQLFKSTAGVHCVGIYENNKLVIACEDVARHNAMDKVIGHCILNDIPLDNKIIFVSGRLSFEMIKKAARVKVPVVVAKSATTSLVIETAQKLNITLVGFVRGKKMNIYTNPHRILFK
ncbi:formate dehydrogenase accessory sulfurtransferase FdhD [Terrisporobacter glycolicus]|nr:formate dehydrogenase accessory sulfurtransferase FdhD [Terrisporobacter glycolicus]